VNLRHKGRTADERFYAASGTALSEVPSNFLSCRDAVPFGLNDVGALKYSVHAAIQTCTADLGMPGFVPWRGGKPTSLLMRPMLLLWAVVLAVLL